MPRPGMIFVPDGMEDELEEELLEEAAKTRHVHFQSAQTENEKRRKAALAKARRKGAELRRQALAHAREDYWRRKYRGRV